MSTPNTTRLGNTTHYFVTKDIPYPRPPSEVCAAARNQLNSIVGLTVAGHDILFNMMLENEGVLKGGVDEWIGFSAAAFPRTRLPDVRQLVDAGILIRKIILDDNSHDHMVVYFLSPGVVA